MQTSPNRERALLGWSDDLVIHRAAEGCLFGREPKRQDEYVTLRNHTFRDRDKRKGQRAYRRGLVN